MNAYSPDQSTSHDAIFASLRAKLCREVRGSAILLAVLERVNKMQAMHTEPEAFKASFDDFVARADDHIGVVRPFFPMLVCFLPSHPGVLCEPHSPECYVLGRRASGISLTS
jgi:hypothetical protein